MLELPPGLLGRDCDLGETRVSPEAIRRYAEMVGDEATLAAAALVAPPTFCLTLHRGMRPEVPLPPGCFGVYGGHDLEFLRPIRAGETYGVVARVADVYEKSGRTGAMTVVAREASIRGADGEPVVRILERQIVRRRPDQAPAGASGGSKPSSRGTPSAGLVSATPPPVEVELGSEIGPQHRPATPVEQVERYVAGGEMREELFTDASYARSLGYRGIVVPGPMLTAFLEHFLRASLPGWRIERLGSTFRMPTITGDPITLSGVVSEHHQQADGEHIVCDLVVEHPSGDRAVTATARLRRSVPLDAGCRVGR